jgi:hypothetical protein
MIDQAIIKALALAVFVFGWTYYAITQNSDVFYYCLDSGFVLLFFALAFLTVKYRDLDYRVNIIGFLFTFSNLIDEFFGDPQKLQINEYVFAIITIIFVIRARDNRTIKGDFTSLFESSKPECLEQKREELRYRSTNIPLEDNRKRRGKTS